MQWQCAARTEKLLQVTKSGFKSAEGHFWGLPVIRGVVALVESLTTGMSTTMDSAKMYGEDAFADEEPTKFEKWLAKTFGKSVENIAITVALVLGVALAVGLLCFFRS